MYNPKYIPVDIVCEVLGHFNLKGSEQHQITVCEEIANNGFHSIEDLLSTIEGYASPRKYKKQLKEVQDSEFFKKYFQPHWPGYKIGDKIKFWEWRDGTRRNAKVTSEMEDDGGVYRMQIELEEEFNGSKFHHVAWDPKARRWESGEL